MLQTYNNNSLTPTQDTTLGKVKENPLKTTWLAVN